MLWSAILKQVAGSKLLLKSKLFVDSEISEKLYADFDNLGISRERLELRSYVNNYAEHMHVYDEVDIALDTFPYNGTTTTCESLWMGVPVITLTAPNHRSRVSASILERINYGQWIANSNDEYVSKAVVLAHDLTQLADAKKAIRDVMISSDLCNEQKFANAIESTYRSIWRDLLLL